MTAGADGVQPRAGNPFPGLRPFEPLESPLFFGRDEQTDDLLTRLGRRRLVAVVGMSGSGKSSLVRAGLLPALDRGYLPAAGTSWHIAIFRPGSDPIANLTRGLATRRLPAGTFAADNSDDIRRVLDLSSLGLCAVARRLLHDPGDSLLIVVDQFEEIFRFGRIAKADATDQAAACVDLLLNVTEQDDVPVYVVLTMRSDYLGDCAQFTGLPEALNDSQFLVPRMTRAQLRAAIECPVAVGGAQITARLVQRLLHEVEDVSETSGSRTWRQQDQDQLPVLQHALMRMWDVSKPARERGEPIDLPHYEQPPVETLSNALDRHAEEVYAALPGDRHREVARRVFQQLTDRDAENREVRRPTPLDELTAVALRTSAAAAHADASLVNDVIAAFSAPGREFVVLSAQQDVDISHESFIRKWGRLRGWVEEEDKSRRVYTKLADVAASWERGGASLYRGPELAEARRWWDTESPTQGWADRYDRRFDVARRFLVKSKRWRSLRRGLQVGNVTVLLVAAVAIAVLMSVWRAQAERTARLAEGNVQLTRRAFELERRGESAQADALIRQAQQQDPGLQAAAAPTSSELAELERLRRQEAVWQQGEASLRKELAAARNSDGGREVAAAKPAELPPPEQAELERLRSAESSWQRETAELKEKLAAATAIQTAGAATPPQAARPTLPRQSEPAATAASDVTAIEQVLREYRAAYEQLDVKTVSRLIPTVRSADLEKSFAQMRAYGLEIVNPQITVTGDTAVVKCMRRITVEPKVGSRQPTRSVATTFKFRRAAGAWRIDAVE